MCIFQHLERESEKVNRNDEKEVRNRKEPELSEALVSIERVKVGLVLREFSS